MPTVDNNLLTVSVSADATLITPSSPDAREVVCADFPVGTRVELTVNGVSHPQSAIVVERPCESLIGLSPIYWAHPEKDLTAYVTIDAIELPDSPGQQHFDFISADNAEMEEQ